MLNIERACTESIANIFSKKKSDSHTSFDR